MHEFWSHARSLKWSEVLGQVLFRAFPIIHPSPTSSGSNGKMNEHQLWPGQGVAPADT